MSQISVVVATRNRRETLARTLARLEALPGRPPVIVVDNGSTDGTADLPLAPRHRMIRLARNRGAHARNYGVAAARTPLVAFSDDDSWWAKGALARAEQLFEAHPRLGLIAARILVGPNGRLDHTCAFMKSAPLGRCADLPGPSVLGFIACGTIVRREAFQANGGFDPVVFFMGEEERLAYDLAATGWGLSYCDDVVAHHHPGAGGPDPAKQALVSRNSALTAWMRRPFAVAMQRTMDAPQLWPIMARLPQALARRRRPDPAVEAALARLQQAPVPQTGPAAEAAALGRL